MCVEEKGCFTCLMIIFGLAGTGWLIAVKKIKIFENDFNDTFVCLGVCVVT